MTGSTLYRRLMRYVRPYWWMFAVSVIGMAAVAAGDLLMAWLVIPVVQNFQTPDPSRTRWLPFAVIAIFALRGIGSYVSEYGMAYTGHRVVFDLRRELIDKLLALPTPFYDQSAAGVVQSKVTFDAHQLASAASGTITTAVRSSLTIAASSSGMHGFWRMRLQPAARARSSCSCPPYPLKQMIGIDWNFESPRTRAISWKPSIPGSDRSVTMTSGAWRRRVFSASSPSTAVITSNSMARNSAYI